LWIVKLILVAVVEGDGLMLQCGCSDVHFLYVKLCRATLMRRSRSTRDRERKDRIKVDLDEIRSLLPTCATDKKMVSLSFLMEKVGEMPLSNSSCSTLQKCNYCMDCKLCSFNSVVITLICHLWMSVLYYVPNS